MSRMLARLIWIASTLGLIGTVVAFAQHPYSLPSPGAMASYTASDRSLTLSHPDNWKPHTLDMHATLSRITFEPAKASWFEVNSDLKGSLMADINRSSSAPIDTTNMPPDLAKQLGALEGGAKKKSPLESAHESAGVSLEKSFDAFQEGAITKLHIAGLEALSTEVTFQKRGLWGARHMTGARLTALANDRRITILYYCPKEFSDVLTPTFKKMADSIRLGQEGQPETMGRTGGR
jgi:hypothetical protein